MVEFRLKKKKRSQKVRTTGSNEQDKNLKGQIGSPVFTFRQSVKPTDSVKAQCWYGSQRCKCNLWLQEDTALVEAQLVPGPIVSSVRVKNVMIHWGTLLRRVQTNEPGHGQNGWPWTAQECRKEKSHQPVSQLPYTTGRPACHTQWGLVTCLPPSFRV